MNKILWISPYVPYDKVGHAGGKTENYYLKQFHNSENMEVFLISFFKPQEESLIDLDQYGISSELICGKKWYKKILNVESTMNPFHRYAGSLHNFYAYHIKNAVRDYKDTFGAPSAIVLQWTPVVLLTEWIHKIFPNVPVVAIEEDVQFLSYRRYWEAAKRGLNKWFWKTRYTKLYRLEMRALQSSQCVCVNNPKDEKLVYDAGICCEKVMVCPPWFQKYDGVHYAGNTKDIIYYGAMARQENYLSAIWFIENVFPQLREEGFRFVVVGSNPDKQLLEYATDDIVFTGFVEDVSPYLENALCIVAPLVLGAGIKVKVLEAFSAGIPLLTNDIGIEGIPAEDKQEFYFCKDPQDYVDRIRFLDRNHQKCLEVGQNARAFIRANYDFDCSFNTLHDKVVALIGADKE